MTVFTMLYNVSHSLLYTLCLLLSYFLFLSYFSPLTTTSLLSTSVSDSFWLYTLVFYIF